MSTYFEDYPNKLGRIIAHLHSLEWLLRVILYSNEAGNKANLGSVHFFLSEGDEVDVNPYTNYWQLGKLVDEYNRQVSDVYKVDYDYIVNLRHCLAHGRVAKQSSDTHLTLVKFKDPNGKNVTTVSNVIHLTEGWFSETIYKTRKEIEKALSGAQSLGLPIARDNS